ncbi:winged helix-turn-helix transcriptional regulator [Aliikangiella coralliicola]|uniref:Leucine-responsive regulatory protein n=1 Tax=Aliikangiella coralliicola TaxID=2592383 RepID=A0A545UDZ9_9GAMM|nr:winged helix-turn-helix transcriptional regulator [Aliikangiella coralliicola]TQV87686.1 winged helix-turn-helix transcriptional regulator [Aliikangiella coralliicola]
MLKPTKTRPLDRIDLAILDALQKNSRISNVNLAKEVNLSASPCLDRVKRLEAEGYIERYGAVLNAAKLKFGLTAYVEVTLDKSTSEVFDSFAERVQEIKQIAECDMVAGGFDYLLKIRISSMAEYRAVLGEVVDIPGVAKNHTYVVIEKIKNDEGLPIV